jgi:dolichol-phosphate mannosyltransferase
MATFAVARRLPPLAETYSMLRFACVGLLGVVVNSSVLWTLTEYGRLYYLFSSVIATELAILHNFALNQRWTFASVHSRGRWPSKLAKFNLIALGGLLLTVVTVHGLTTIVGMHYMIANLFAVGVGSTWNYAANRLWTWRGAIR